MSGTPLFAVSDHPSRQGLSSESCQLDAFNGPDTVPDSLISETFAKNERSVYSMIFGSNISSKFVFFKVY